MSFTPTPTPAEVIAGCIVDDDNNDDLTPADAAAAILEGLIDAGYVIAEAPAPDIAATLRGPTLTIADDDVRVTIWIAGFAETEPGYGRYVIGHEVEIDPANPTFIRGEIRSGVVEVDSPPDMGDYLRSMLAFLIAGAEQGRPGRRPHPEDADETWTPAQLEQLYMVAEELGHLQDHLTRAS